MELTNLRLTDKGLFFLKIHNEIGELLQQTTMENNTS